MPARGATLVLVCSLALGCLRAPSSVPLGGDEWVPPEPHHDRRPKGAPQVARATPQAAAPAGPSPPSSAPAAVIAVPAAKPTPASELAFAFTPLAKGDRVTLRTRYLIRASFDLSAEGAVGPQSLEAEAAERIEVLIAEAGPDRVRQLEVEYAESRTSLRMPGVPDVGGPGRSNAGKRYAVSFGEGGPTVTPRAGSLEPDEDKGVLFDLATVTGYVPLAKAQLPTTLAPGWRARVSTSDLRQVFGAFDTVRFDAASLELSGRAPGSDLALFDCSLPVHYERDGMAVSANLSGTFTARTSDARPVSVLLRGPLSGRGNLPIGDASKLSGTLEVSLEHGYRR